MTKKQISSKIENSGLHKGIDKRWLAMLVLCLGVLMIILDTTIVNVALPSIKEDLNFSESNLAWVVNAYMLTFGGFLLLGGKLGDIFGHKKLFLIGIVSFTVASLLCGISGTKTLLITWRAIQGIGGAIVSAVSLSLIMDLFTEPAERAKAMGFFGFVGAGGGAVGVLLGGILTTTFDWNWIFLVNIPIGAIVFFLSRRLIPEGKGEGGARHIDFAGAFTVTASLMIAVYAIVNGNLAGWKSMSTLGMLFASAVLLGSFIIIESKAKYPLMPLSLFGFRNVAVANIIGVLWAASMFAWFFLSALYMQGVLQYTPMQVGLSFLPANIIMAIFSLGLSARIVRKFGNKIPILAGMLIASIGLLLFARAPLLGEFATDVLLPMVLLGFGAGMAFNPLLLSAMSDVTPRQSGLASGIVNTSFMMGGALGLAILASIAAARSASSNFAGTANGLLVGYHMAFLIGAVFAISAGLLAVFLRPLPKNSKAASH